MKINDFILHAIKDKAHHQRAWCIAMLAVTLDDPEKQMSKMWSVLRTAQEVQVLTPEGVQVLEDAQLGKPIAGPSTTVFVPKDFFSQWPQGGFTTFGNLLYNSICLWPIFDGRWPYMNSEAKQGDIEKRFAEMLDDPDNEKMRDPSKIYVSDWLRYGQTMKYLEELSPLVVWTLSDKAIVPNKEVQARKEELLKIHAHELENPVVQAKIFKELEDLDASHLANEPGKSFVLSGKSKLIRRKLTIMVGSEQGLDVGKKPVLITQSLHDGLRPEHMIDIMNVSRAGSFDRGAETMYGGVEAKGGERAAAGAYVNADDCGTTLGYTYKVTPHNINNTQGRWRMHEGFTKLIESKEEANALIGETITVRAPNYCRSGPGVLWCKMCLGKALSDNPDSITSTVSAYGSGFLQLFLQSMHAKAAVVVKLRIRDHMS